MTELAPCPSCQRHVATRERVCPFCAQALPPLRAQRISLRGRVSRAAVFTAALAACSSDKPKQPAPSEHGSGSGSDDLEKLLDDQPRAAPHPDAPPIDAATVIVDAGVPDAALPDAGVVKKKRHVEHKVENIETKHIETNHIETNHIQNAKPYGAPPARRRVV